MGIIVGVAVSLFLAFSFTLAWVGGDREKAALEDTIKKAQMAQASMSAEAQAQGERVDELQNRLEDSLIGKNRPERGPASAETGKGPPAGNKPSSRFLDPEPSILDDAEPMDPLGAAEASLRRESSARSEAEKRLFEAQRAVSYLETELNESIGARRDWIDTKAVGEFCPWDPGRR